MTGLHEASCTSLNRLRQARANGAFVLIRWADSVALAEVLHASDKLVTFRSTTGVVADAAVLAHDAQGTKLAAPKFMEMEISPLPNEDTWRVHVSLSTLMGAVQSGLYFVFTTTAKVKYYLQVVATYFDGGFLVLEDATGNRCHATFVRSAGTTITYNMYKP